MPLPIPLTTELQKGGTAYGFWLTFPSTALARTILRAPPRNGPRYSWVLVDAEHGLITDRDYYDLAAAVAAEGASPLVRVPCAAEWMVKRALDAGAHGVLTPMCHTAADAAAVVRWCKYPGAGGGGGSRGYGPMFAVHGFANDTDVDVDVAAEYDSSADRALLVAVQIESQQGVDNVEAIAAVPGLDVLLIGPFDLALQMGVARGSAAHEAAIQRTLAACRAHGKRAAIFCTGGAQARQRAAEGFDMVSVVTDVGAMGLAMAEHVAVASDTNEGAVKEKDAY